MSRRFQQSFQPTTKLLKSVDTSILINVAEIIADFVAIFTAVLCSFIIYSWLNDFHNYKSSNSFIIAPVISFFGLLIFEFFGLYKKQLSLMNLIEIKKIIQGVSTMFLCIVIVHMLFNLHYPPVLFFYSALLVLLFVLAERMIIFKLQQSLHKKGFNITRIMVMGAGDEALLIYHYILQAPKYGYKIVGFLSPGNPEELEPIQSKFKSHSLLLLEDLNEFKKKIEASQINELWICSPDLILKKKGFSNIQHVCQHCGISLRFAPFLSGYYPGKFKYTDIGGIPMISFEAASQNAMGLFLKRIFDLCLSFILILILSPLFLLFTILIGKNSNGPAIFKQERVGKDGELFLIYKFRTMYMNSPKYENSPTSSDDSRITKLGKFLRKTSLDELPQLFNVLKGDMSLVGPRPEMPFIVENEYDDFLRQRLRVKPGITGVWQVSGDRTKEIHENISYDIFYIANRSLLLDLIILVRTILFAIMAMKTH